MTCPLLAAPGRICILFWCATRRRARTGIAPVSVSAISLHYVYHILRDFKRFFCYNEMNDFLFAGVIFMFRELSRKNKEISYEECVSVLTSETRGVLSVNGDGGYPYGMPMNHFYDVRTGKIYFHCGKSGHRIDSLINDDRVSFCVFDKGFKKDGEWALNVKSVIVFGRIKIIEDIDVITEIATKLSHKFTSDDEYINKEIRAFAPVTKILELTPEHVCGKLVNES